jgi:hypothetical protein
VKTLLRSFVARLLALSVLVSTTGATFQRHFCQMADEEACHLAEQPGPASCCALHAARHTGATDDGGGCCALETEFKKTEAGPVQDQSPLFIGWVAVLPPAVAWGPVPAAQRVVPQPQVLAYTNPSPPLPGRQRVVLHHHFRL